MKLKKYKYRRITRIFTLYRDNNKLTQGQEINKWFDGAVWFENNKNHLYNGLQVYINEKNYNVIL